jgi:hypothetical protein
VYGLQIDYWEYIVKIYELFVKGLGYFFIMVGNGLICVKVKGLVWKHWIISIKCMDYV